MRASRSSDARNARLHILDKMHEALPAPREEMSPYAPKIETVQIPVKKIGELIGPGGKVIKKIQEDTGATIEVDCTAPAAVTGITAAPRHNKVEVSWTHDMSDVDHFEAAVGEPRPDMQSGAEGAMKSTCRGGSCCWRWACACCWAPSYSPSFSGSR